MKGEEIKGEGMKGEEMEGEEMKGWKMKVRNEGTNEDSAPSKLRSNVQE